MKYFSALLLISLVATSWGDSVVTLPYREPSATSVGNSTSISTSLPESSYPWKRLITATIFWIGEQASRGNSVPNNKSSWDSQWQKNYGGYDNPDPRARNGSDYTPVSLSAPKQNPFYVALPYNDVDNNSTKPEAGLVIPWFRTAFEQNGKSVCKGRWIKIRCGGKICYAQWEDVGPFRTDHWEYVFGNARPGPNRNHSAGIDISPAIRDFLGADAMTQVDWKFVEFYEVPEGPWREHGENNIYVTHRELAERLHDAYVHSRRNIDSVLR
jgi:hypothetical protein